MRSDLPCDDLEASKTRLQAALDLLAAVDPDDADELVSRLRALGHGAARIGQIVAGSPVLRCRSGS